MAKTINIILYPKFTEQDIITMLKMRSREDETLSNGHVVSKNNKGVFEIEIEEKDYEVEE
ncbi:MAG: hypothetical protein WC325_10330 [Candidatus Bathyarchaeia archaeon]|jgi:hypothetical protein